MHVSENMFGLCAFKMHVFEIKKSFCEIYKILDDILL